MVAPWRIFGRLGNQLFQYAFLYANARDTNTDYYLQDPKYFQKYEKDIKILFGQDIRPIDMVAIHVRRGDYVGNPFYVNLMATTYYERAMEKFKGAKFIVFSDDIPFCKSQSTFIGCEFSEGKSDVEDLNLMAGCKGIIISNSSFSWWAAYLGDSNKKVIAPLRWYSDGIERTVCPSNWERI